MQLYEQLNYLMVSRPNRLLFLFGVGLTLLSLIGLWINIRLGMAVIVLFIAGAYLVNVLYWRVHQQRLKTNYRQLEALHLLMNVISFRIPLSLSEGAASPDLLLLLCREILTRKPQCVVECGAGVSTLLIGYALEKVGQGQLISLEHDEGWTNRVTHWVKEHGLEARIQVIHAPLAQHASAQETYQWYAAEAYQPALSAQPPIDLLFVDGPPGHHQTHTRLPAVPILRQYFSPRCMIVMDDTARQSEAYTARVWADQLNYHLTNLQDFARGAAVLQPNVNADNQ